MASSKTLRNLDGKKMLFAAWAGSNHKYTACQSFSVILRKMFRNFTSFDPQKIMYKYGQKEMNERFLEIVEREKPDYVFFWLMYDDFYIDTLLRIREISPKAVLINFFGDDDSGFDNYSRHYAPFFDCSLIYQESFLKFYKREGILNTFGVMGLDTTVSPQKIAKECDVTFIGTPKSDRYELLKYLKDNGVAIRIYGSGWEKYPNLKEVYFGCPSQKESNKIINSSKINISFTKNYLGESHLKGRVFEIMVCKSFALTEYFKDFLRFFKKNEVVMFEGKEDLLNKINYYLKHDEEREKIAEMAYKRVVRDYSQNKKIEEAIFRTKRNKPLRESIESCYKVEYISPKDLALGTAFLKEKLRDFDYVGFRTDKSKNLKYKDYFQAHALSKSGKEISCCDYYLYSPKLGDYLALYSNFAFKLLGEEDFFSLMDISQLMVKKAYFLDNLDKFIAIYCGKKTNLITEKNTAFVGIPLVRVSGFKPIGKKQMEEVFFFKFEDRLRILHNKKKLLIDPYLYRLVYNSISRKDFILRYLYNKLKAALSNKMGRIL